MSVVAQQFVRNAMEDSSSYALARVMNKSSAHNMVAAVAADLTSISRSVFEYTAGVLGTTAIIGPTTLVTADVMLVSLSTGDIWTLDTTGFNFIDTVPTTAFPTGGSVYNLRYTFTTTTSLTFILTYKVPVVAK